MISETARRRSVSLLLLAGLSSAAIASFVTEPGEADVDLGSETARLLQNQLRSNTKLQVLDPDHPPLNDALEKVLEKLGPGGKYNKQEKEQFRLETDRVLQDPEFW